MNKDIFNKAALVVGGALIGGSTTYFVLSKKLEKKYFDQAEEEIASVKRTYKLLTNELPEEEAREAFDEYNQQLDALNYRLSRQDPDRDLSEEDEEDEEDSVTHPEEDGTVELMTVKAVDVTGEPRTPDKPYLITTQEFMDDEEDYSKFSITYYEEDDTLVDERDEIIPDINTTIGTDFVTRWGDGSDDENVVYIRNERLETDFEVRLEQNSWVRATFGVEPDEAGTDRIQRARRLSD